MTDSAAPLASLQQPERHTDSRPANARWSYLQVLANLGMRGFSSAANRRRAGEYVDALAIAGVCTAIGSLRRKLEIEPSRPKYILTELGIGYRLVMDAEPANDSSLN
jgi:hypothetical protein